MIIKFYKDYIDAINEGLIKTIEPEKVLNDIIRTLSLMGFNVDGRLGIDKIFLSINDFNSISVNKIEILFDHIMVSIVNRGGWFPSTMYLINIHGLKRYIKYDFNEIITNHSLLKSVEITFESKFDKIENNIPNKLYHLSIMEYDKKIKKYGLIVKSKSKLSSHLDRIYLCKSKKDCESLIPQMTLYYTNEKDYNVYVKGKKLYNKDITPVIYEVDGTIIDKLYIDPNYTDGYYTLDNIKSEFIKKI